MSKHVKSRFFNIGKCFSEFCAKDLTHLDRADKIKKLWKAYSDFGLFNIIVPRKYGGIDLDLQDIIDLMLGMGYGSSNMGIMFAANVQIWAIIKPLLHFGTDSLIEKYISKLSSGQMIGAHAISESEAGSDIFALSTQYLQEDTEYVINGSKNFVTNAPLADLYIIYAKNKNESKKNRMHSVSCFMVEKGIEGFSVGLEYEKVGMSLSLMGSVYLDNCRVSKDMLLGVENQGYFVFQNTMINERIFLLVFQVGIMQKQFEDCLQYVKGRKQGGQSIFVNQSVSNRIADMRVRLEVSNILILNIIDKIKRKQDITLESSIAKLCISDNLYKNSFDAMMNYGTIGYLDAHNVAQQLLDSLGSYFYSGTSDIQRNLIARLS